MLPTHKIRLKSLLKEHNFEEQLISAFLEFGKLKKAVKGEYLLSPGMKINYLPIIISGRIRTYRSDNEGHEITLFYSGMGDTCTFAINSIINQTPLEIGGIVEKST